MRLRIRGHEVLDLATGQDARDPEPDLARDLSGGTLASDRIETWLDGEPPLIGFTRRGT